jgi:hypothetical protein
MAIQLTTFPGRAEHTNPQFETRSNTWNEIPWRPAAAVAGLAVAAAAIGGLIWPAEFVSKKSISLAIAPVSVVEEVTPVPAVPLAEVRTGAIDAATPLSTAGMASPGSTASSQNTSSENPSDTRAVSRVGLTSSSAAADDRAAGSEEPKTAPVVTSEVIAARELAPGETQKDEDSAARQALFREFLQWQAARVSSVAPSARQNAAKRDHRLQPQAATSTPVATHPQLRSTHPSSAAQATPITSPVARPRRAHVSNAQAHATIEQVAPASATAKPPSF